MLLIQTFNQKALLRLNMTRLTLKSFSIKAPLVHSGTGWSILLKEAYRLQIMGPILHPAQVT